MSYKTPQTKILTLLREAQASYGNSTIAALLNTTPQTLKKWETTPSSASKKEIQRVKQLLLNFGKATKFKSEPVDTHILRFGELFCGPGGLAKGLLLAQAKSKGQTWRFRHAFATDIDDATCQTYARNICQDDASHVFCEDIRTANTAKYPKIDLLAFGFPCNDFSIVGEQKGVKGAFGPLYTYGVKILNEQRPLAFIAENVGGLQSANEGKAFQTILNELKNAGPGYTLTPHLYKFEEYGVPQRRHRIIIVGLRNDLNLHFEVPAPFTKQHPISVAQALEDIDEKEQHNHEKTAQSSIVIRRLALLPEGANAWYLDEMLELSDKQLMDIVSQLPHHEKFKTWTPAEIRKEIQAVKLNVISARMSQIYRRLEKNRPAYTLTGSGGGGTHTYHWHENRALTNRERARLQTFPDDFIFMGSKEEVRKQIGMAVPVVGMKVIGEAILKTLAGIPYENVQAKWAVQ